VCFGSELRRSLILSRQLPREPEIDDRISIAVATEHTELSPLTAVYAGAHVREITSQRERDDAWRLLMMRNSNLAGFNIPDARDAAFMRARCKYVSVLDNTQGFGHREQIVEGEQGVPTATDISEDHRRSGAQ